MLSEQEKQDRAEAEEVFARLTGGIIERMSATIDGYMLDNHRTPDYFELPSDMFREFMAAVENSRRFAPTDMRGGTVNFLFYGVPVMCGKRYGCF